MTKNLDGADSSGSQKGSSDERASRLAEMAALQQLEGVLGVLPVDSVERVLRWYGESRGVARAGRDVEDSSGGAATLRSRGTDTRSNLSDLFDRANPQTAPERALIVSYWLQMVQGVGEFDSQRVNTELKNLGFPSSNITADFTKLGNRTPSEARQVRKEGRSNQARKKYRLTREGIRRAQTMIGVETDDQHNQATH